MIGRHPLTLGALCLAALSGYELWIRIDDFWRWTSGIRHLSRVRGTPFWEDLRIIFETPEMQDLGYTMLFLIFTLLFALSCIVRRSRGGWFLMLLDLAAAGSGAYLGLYSLHPSGWIQIAKLIPLGLILAGCWGNMAHRAVWRKRERRRESRSHWKEA